MGNVPVNGVQSVPSASCTSHAQLDGGVPGGTSGAESGWVSLRTKVDVEFATVGFTPHKSVLVLPGISKHGSLIPLPTAHRQASGRNGAAMEFVQQEPLSTGAEPAGWIGVYAMTCVYDTAGGVCVAVEVVWFAGALMFEDAKNCPTPNSMTSTSTTTTMILLDFFIQRHASY
jgi:hypothetical protein